MKKHFQIGISLVILAILAVVVFVPNDRKLPPPSALTLPEDRTNFKVEVARTKEEQLKGLSGRKSLDKNKGMLFIFDKPAVQCMWGKDMLFDLLVTFLDDFGNAVSSELMPAGTTDPHCSKVPVRYVLETNPQ